MYKTISSQEIFSHPRLTLIEDQIILPNGTQTDYLKFKNNNSSIVTIIPQRTDGKILLEKEYAYPPNQQIFQFPGGSVASQEETTTGANRELMEECNLIANKLTLLGHYLGNSRRSNIKVFVYLATELTEKSLPADPEESIEIFWKTEDEITKMIQNNKILQSHALSAWALYLANKN